MSEAPTRCHYFPECNACQLWDMEYAAQKELKTKDLAALLQSKSLSFPLDIDFVSCGDHGLRNRIDFTFKLNASGNAVDFGFYNRAKQLVPVKKCLQLTPELQKIFDDFISLTPKVGEKLLSKGSVRLRSGVGDIKGCWLDLSNLDIKDLLTDETYLRALLAKNFHIEMGQKGKSVRIINDKLKLSDPVPNTWFKSLAAGGKEFPLRCLVSDFTQPSWVTAAELTNTVLDWVSSIDTTAASVLEFGPGIGQFTVALLSEGHHVTALEIDQGACENLIVNSRAFTSNLKIVNDDFQRKGFVSDASILLVNPARSGLKNFVTSIIDSKAEALIYISCFPESLCEDLAKLKNNFEIKKVKIVDQFPQTRHFESCVFLKRIK